MKKIVIVLSVLAFGILPSLASASLLLTEQFNYPNGNLVGNGGWANHSGTGFFIQVTDGTAVLQQGAGSREDANVPLSAARSNTDVTYAAVQVTVPSATVFGTGDYFAHFKSATTMFPTRVFLMASPAGGDFTFGVSASSTSLTVPIVAWPSGFSFGSTHLVVMCYNAATGVAKLWVDPTSESDPSISGFNTAIGDAVSAFALRQGSVTTSTQVISGILVGTTFGDVVGGTVVPAEETSWGGVKALFR